MTAFNREDAKKDILLKDAKPGTSALSVALIAFGIFLYSPLIGLCQTPSATPVETPSASDGSLYRFHSDTVWGKLNVLVRDLHGGFKVQVQSELPALGWTLKEDATSRTFSKGGLNPTNQFQFQVGQPFQGSYRLTIFLDSDREEVPAVVRLSAQKEDKAETAAAETLDDYQENPDRPYNTMVKNLYNQAVADYAKGDHLSALSHLRKAEELDPTQPQVQALFQKIQGPSETDSASPLDKIRRILKKGNKEEALAKVDDYLDAHPDDSEALELKDQIEGKETTHRASKPKAKKEKTTGDAETVPHKKQAKLSDQEAQAQADQAYNLGLESYRRGDYAAAKKFWEETLQIQPTHPHAQRNLDRLKQEHPELK